jgi:hypothetical protein
MPVHSPDRYLTKVVDEFASEANATFESRKRLWQMFVLVYELSSDPEPWIDKLLEIAGSTGMRQRDTQTTLVSALRRARQSGAVA